MKRLDGRIAMITGASRGIGKAVAIRYAMEGAHLIVLATKSRGLEELDDKIKQLTGQNIALITMDLESFEEIEQLGQKVYERYGQLDILVGNAGVLGDISPLTHIKPDIWKKVININLSANWYLLRTFDPLLRRSAAGRVIFVTSTVGSVPRSYWGPYSVSKSGLEMMTKIYAAEQAKTSINANLINPGATRTSMRAKAMPGEDPKSVKPPEEITESFVLLAERSCMLNGETIDGSVKTL